jgi:hypothetical protein
MSTERKPIIDDMNDFLDKEHFSTMGFYHSFSDGELRAAGVVRSFYEDLITTGKLRVVEEVTLNHYHECSGCGYNNGFNDEFSGMMEDNLNTCCAGCGNPIKRNGDQA